MQAALFEMETALPTDEVMQQTGGTAPATAVTNGKTEYESRAKRFAEEESGRGSTGCAMFQWM